MSIQLIVTDLDGTVLDEENRIPDRVREAFRLARQKGIPAVIATGRTMVEMTDAQDAIGADHFSITMNGAFIYDHHRQEALNHQHLERQQVITVIKLLESYSDVFFHAYGNNQPICSEKTLHTIHMSGAGPAYVAMYNATQKVVPDLIPFIQETGLEINKFYITSQNVEHLNQIKVYANALKGVRCLQSMPRGIEIIPETVDKSFAIQLLCNHMGIDIARTLVIGDSENDIGMLKVGGISVVMGNAPAYVKAFADWIAPTNLEQGAAAAIERYVLAD
jgi:Cof subfamily protein (haloacid dehalogenase superfamily)